MKRIIGFTLIIVGFSACTTSADRLTPSTSTKTDISLVLEQALEAHGGIDAIAESGVTISLTGEFDLATRLQGRSPDRPEPTPIRERISVDYEGGRVGYDIDWYNYYSSNQKLREIYDDQRRILFIDLRAGGGGYLPRQSIADAKERYTRFLPNLLLAEMLQNPDRVDGQWITESGNKPYLTIGYQLPDESIIHVRLDPDTSLIQEATNIIDMPLIGPSLLTWKWDGYEKAEKGMAAPSRLQVFLGEKKLKDVSVAIELGTDEKFFTAPDGITVGEVPEELTPLSEIVPYGQREPAVETVEPNVHMVRNLRPGFNMMFIEFPDFVLAVDAPTGWYEMQQLPPKNWSIGDDTDALGRKYLKAIKETVPDKPLKYLALTHHHSDHIGGYQPFADAGVTFLTGKAAASIITAQKNSQIEAVRGIRSIKNGDMVVQLIELADGNPKADNYLMVYLPAQKILYTTGFIYPVPESAFPPPESVDLSIWFVEWLDSSGLEIDRIYNVHGNSLVEDWQLERIRQIAAEKLN